jgi:hypothetical protein
VRGAPPAPSHEARALRFHFEPREYATPGGFRAESGARFDAERGHGWDREVETEFARTNLGPVRNSYVAVDNRSTATFSIRVPNGRYRVSLLVGSPKSAAEHRVAVEGQVAVRDLATRAGGFVEVRDLEVTVHDGELDVTLGGSGRRGKTKLCSLEVEPVESAAPETAQAGLRVFGCNRTRLVPSLELSSPVPAPLRVALYDARGTLVRVLWRGELRVSRLQLQWDGHDDRGRTVASGMYFVRADLGRRTFSGKLLLLR